jgi:hypothetical protein
MANDIQDMQRKRFQFLKKLYEITGADESVYVSPSKLRDELGFADAEIDRICEFLSSEGLIGFDILDSVCIEHKGISEVEIAVSKPNQPTLYFPPIINYIYIEQMTGSQIQQGTAQSFQAINTSEHLELDRQTFKKLIEILPWNGSIQFIRHNNFAGSSFVRDRLDSLYKFCWECKNPSFEFMDTDLESMRAKLLETIEQFLDVIDSETFPTDKPKYNTVPPEWEIEQPDRFKEAVNNLHSLAHKAYDNYGALVKTGRRKLGVQ